MNTTRSGLCAFGLCFSALMVPEGLTQNVIQDAGPGVVLAPMKVDETEATALVRRAPKFGGGIRGAEAARIATKLEAHVRQFLKDGPWMPFQHTLGISGYEIYFDHPDEEFYALALALPWLTRTTADRVRKFLEGEAVRHPPYAVDGFERATGHPRESYDVPESLRIGGAGSARSAFGTYALWAWCRWVADPKTAQRHWEPVKERMMPLLKIGEYPFDPAKLDYTQDEAAKLNGDLAGVLATARLARMNQDAATEKMAVAQLTRLLGLRANLERINPHILERSHTLNRTLHVSRLARYSDLTPEIGDAVARLSEGCGATRLASFRERRNGWFMAYGDRYVGGENYTSPSDFSRALFAGAVFIETLPADRLLSFIDVPWCHGDFYFMEKCALALWVSAGAEWEDVGEVGR